MNLTAMQRSLFFYVPKLLFFLNREGGHTLKSCWLVLIKNIHSIDIPIQLLLWVLDQKCGCFKMDILALSSTFLSRIHMIAPCTTDMIRVWFWKSHQYNMKKLNTTYRYLKQNVSMNNIYYIITWYQFWNNTVTYNLRIKHICYHADWVESKYIGHMCIKSFASHYFNCIKRDNTFLATYGIWV